MRVLHVIPAVAPRYGGPSQVVFEMCHALKERGIESLIATTDADGTRRLPVALGKPVVHREVPTIFFSRQWSEAFKYSNPLARWLVANVAGFDLAHIHAVFSHASLAAARACRRRNVPYVVRPLGALDPWGRRHKWLRKRIIHHIAAKRMLQRAAAIHYTTAEERRLAENGLGLGGGVVIPIGVREELLNAPSPSTRFRERFRSLEGNPYALILCRLHPVKALELLLEAFLVLAKQREFERWRLVVAGDGEAGYVASLRRLVRQGGGTDRVIFTGWLDDTEKISALQGAALLTLPSHQESFGLSVVEALACGVPVLVSTQVNLAAEISAAGAGWVVPLERTALLRALAKAFREEGERASRGAAGRDLVHSRFTWSRIGAELAKLYASVTAHPLPVRV